MELRDYLMPDEYIMAFSEFTAGKDYKESIKYKLVLTNKRLLRFRIAETRFGFISRNKKEKILSIESWNLADISEVIYRENYDGQLNGSLS
ncbi:hypothetical protein [Thermococcus sp.]